MFYLIEDSFIRFDHKKSIVIDYDGVSDESSFLKVEIYFEASENFDLDWYFKGDKIQIREETDNDLSLKFISKCVHTGIFNYYCFLFINPYTKQDIGMYSANVRLKSDPDVHRIELKSHAIMPSKIILK